ncbi:hypothetical protein AVEN_53920-1 [Araneus ventricosus]|uniref:Uncharacterized protein n=1 Tax=Araneus ventricosus TaxID=182803 RepID=A0A4Y2MIW5_ARAVE|nr:hypothetical protein AVEN_53920-1 [Araneus ventricosus]
MLSEKEEKVLEKKEIEEKRREKKRYLASTSSAVNYVSSSDESIKIRQIKRKESTESIKVVFENDIPQILIVHWGGQLARSFQKPSGGCNQDRFYDIGFLSPSAASHCWGLASLLVPRNLRQTWDPHNNIGVLKPMQML